MSLTQPLEDANKRAPELQQIAADMLSNNLPVEDAIVKTLKQTVPLPEEKYDFNYKFKKLMPSFMERLNPNYVNTNNKLSGVLYTVGLTFGKSTKFTVEKLKALSNQVYVASVGAKAGLDKTQELIVLAGQKAQVLKAKEKIQQNLKDAGVSFDNVMVNKSYVEADYDKIHNYLKAQSIQLGFNTDIDLGNPETYNLSIFKNPEIPANLKKEIVEKVVWSKIKHEIQQNMSLISIATNLQGVDPYIRQLKNAAQENNMAPDALVLVLSNNPQMALLLKGGNKLVSNKDKIITATQKYTEFINSATYIAAFHVNLAKQAFSRYLSPEEDKNFTEEKFLLLNQEDLSLKDIDERLVSVGFIEQFKIRQAHTNDFKVEAHANTI